MEQEKQLTSLPENAYRELKPGEEYTPIMPASSSPREVTPYSVTMGIVMAIVFSAAAAFLGLKVGQVFEAAIPIAIIAVGMGNVLGKKNMLGQNVIIQSIGASSGVIVAGAIFTLPALYILGLDAAFYQVFLSSLFGGLLGIVLLIPFRKYFVKEMHGKYPFPEATATTEVLISGEKGGNQAKLLAVAGLIGGLYDFAVGTFGMWTESVSTRICAWGQVAADKFKVVFSLNTSAAVLGLGYIIGLKYAMIITAGSCLVWFLVVPLVGSLADTIDPAALGPRHPRPAVGDGGGRFRTSGAGIRTKAGMIRANAARYRRDAGCWASPLHLLLDDRASRDGACGSDRRRRVRDLARHPRTLRCQEDQGRPAKEGCHRVQEAHRRHHARAGYAGAYTRRRFKPHGILRHGSVSWFPTAVFRFGE